MDTFLLILAFVVALLGAVGSVVPAIPGPVFSYLALWIGRWSGVCAFDNRLMWITFAITVAVIVSDYIFPQMILSKMGGSRYGAWGATVGMIAGMFLTPVGMILGMILGAFAGEFIFSRNSAGHSIRATVGSILGFIVGTGLKLSFAIYAIYILAVCLPRIF